MRKILFSLFCLSFLLSAVSVNAQRELSKDEEKEWKKTAKEYVKNPAALAQMTKDKQELQRINNSLESDMNLLRTQVNAKDNRISSLESQVNQLNLELEAARNAEPPRPDFTPTDSPGEVIPMGTIFRVQIGAFERDKNKIPGALESGQDLALENAGGLQKVVLGQFTNKDDAEALKKHLRKIGVKDAWVVKYMDGVRVE